MQRILVFDQPHTQPDAEPRVSEDGPQEEFELVVGRRQIAAITFLVLVILAVCSGASYLVGKAISAREEQQQAITLEQPPALEQAPAPLPTSAMLEATIVPAPTQSELPAELKSVTEAPLFGNPVAKAIYIQVGAVEKGVATVIAEGLRKHALASFVAPGPSEKTFRVLIGPFPNAEAYQKARNIVDQIGLASFARQYQPQ